MAYRSSGAGYADVAAHYRKAIDRGDLAPGDSLPSVPEIREQFDVSAKTVSRALKVLKDEGLVVSAGAAGTVVSKRPRIAPATGTARVSRTRQGGPNYAPGETSTNHEAMIRSCKDPIMCHYLDIDPHDEVVIRRRVFRQDGTPKIVGIEVIHPRALAVVSDLAKQGPRGAVHWFVQYEEATGKKIHGSPERRAARFASRDELELLEVPLPDSDVAVPVLVTHTVFHDEDGPLEVMEDVHYPGLWHEARS
ncbi:GntR family transcriptional regulator [Streptomyces sp. TRM76323]|uniref:GntR family transcriptional regulator n=1 Tax=Streptomyces tamarix TaxID=3078565 RepID=A0ABU3QUE3_9ACTN|nr:GntR family transcriptional regulator [Streptomyces tamarix]MDT9686405.1 GntR family transcriptional regulator [Streptomyces tamarix]